MNRFQNFALTAALVMAVMWLIPGCDSDDPVYNQNFDQPEAAAQWAILLYLAGTYPGDVLDGDTDAGESLYRSIETIKRIEARVDMPEVQVLACMGSPATEGHVTIRRIQTRHAHSDELVTSEVIEDLGMADMADRETFRRFIELGAVEYSAERTVLAVQGLSDGWLAGCIDVLNGNNNALEIFQMHSVLTDVVNGPLDNNKFDILLWMSPEMSSVEVSLEFSEIADYMVAVPWNRQFSFFDAVDVWYFDLIAQPQMGSLELAQRMIDGARHISRLRQEPIHANLIDMSRGAALADAFNLFAENWNAASETHFSLFQEFRNEIWQSAIDDSNHVDLSAMLNLMLSSPELSEEAGLLESAGSLKAAMESAVVMSYASPGVTERTGLMLYYPLEIDSALHDDYLELQVAQESPAWSEYLGLLLQLAATRVEVTGRLEWAGSTLESYDLYFFLNTHQYGQPQISLVTPVALSDFETPSVAQYRSLFAPAEVSTGCYVGLFADIDEDGMLSTGDRFGYYDEDPDSGQPRTWVTIEQGSVISDYNIVLNFTQN